MSVLGAALLSRAAATEVVELLGPDDFYRSAHRIVFEAIQELMNRSEPVDPVTLLDHLVATDRLDQVGGAVAVQGLAGAVPTAANAAHYARIVANHSLMRKVIEAGTEIVQLGYTPTDDPREAVNQAESLMYDVAEGRVTSEATALKGLLNDAFEEIERRHQAGDDVVGLPTGFRDLDRMTAGFQPQNLIILAARPAMGKCQPGSTIINMADTGERISLAEAVERGRAGKLVTVSSLNAAGRIQLMPVSAFHHNGHQEVATVESGLGRRTTATRNHPFLTPTGWRALGELQCGDLIAVPRQIHVEGVDRKTDAELESFLAGSDHQIPEPVFRLPNDQVRLFLSRLFATDGSAWVAEQHGYFGISYTSVSRELIDGVVHLLLRLGIIARVRERRVKYVRPDGKVEYRPANELEIRDAENVLRFLDEVGIFSKEEACDRVRAAAEARTNRHTNTDLLPIQVWDEILAAKGDRSWADVSEATGRPRNHNWHVGKRRPSRRLLAELAEALDDDGLRAQATSDVYWDEVVSITDAGFDEVYDLTVPGLHNFVADDVIVHNSTLMLSMAQYVTAELKKPVAIFSLEMSKIEIVMRLLSSEAGVDGSRIKTGKLEDTDWRKLGDALGKLAEAPLYIDDTPSITMLEILSKCRRLKQRDGLDMVIVDYMQLMTSHKRVDNRQQEVAEISRGMKMLAKELDIPVIALSQLNRSPEMRTDKRPMLADLRESGSVEQDADIVGFIYRDEVYDAESPDRGIAELIIAKHRNGATGTVKLAFLGHLTKFANLSRGPAGGFQDGGPPTAPPPPMPPPPDSPV